jgi:holo-[acyl-carrier protein] synthase
MIVGIGCDVIKIARVVALIGKIGDKFLNRIYTKSEIEAGKRLSQGKSNDFFAKRFAAKEAVSKAIGTGIGEKLSFLDIEVLNDTNGRPLVNLAPAELKKFRIHLSLADEDGIAIAYALAEII